MMGSLARKSGGAAALRSGKSSSGGIVSMLTPLLDANRDGSVVDDVTGMIGRFLGRS
jgi:hypothetical protein